MRFFIMLNMVYGLLINTINGLHAADLNLTRSDSSQISIELRSQTMERSKQLLVIFQGSDCNSVAWNRNIHLTFSKVMPEADILTIEKYGITPDLPYSDINERPDCPASHLENDTPEQRVADATQILQQLHKTGQYEHMVLMGGSEGAYIVQMLANRLKFISAAISLNHGGALFKTTILHNITETVKDPVERKIALQGFEQFHEKILSGPYFDVFMSGHKYNWWRNILQLNQYEELKNTTVPILLIQGLLDINTSPDQALDLWARLEAAGKNNIRTKSFPDLDHMFQDKTGKDYRLSVVQFVKDWLIEVLQNQK